jgi:hypothetical protein
MMIRQSVRVDAVQQYAVQHDCDRLTAARAVNRAIRQCADSIDHKGICGTEILDQWSALTDLPQIFLLDMLA